MKFNFQFTVWQVLECGARFLCDICDSDCIFRFKVISRTEKTITLQDEASKEIRRRRPNVWDGQEVCFPQGYYSMCPILRA